MRRIVEPGDVEPTEENIRAWDEAHRGREQPEGGLPPVVRARLPELRGRHVLHLRCGTGEATRDLAELGALVTGVDPAPTDVAAARVNAPTAAFFAGAVDDLPLDLRRGRFHLVYAARGTLAAARAPDAFAAGVVAALRPGGFLLHHDDHPVAYRVDPMLRWRGSYFDRDAPRLDVLVTAVAQAGLTVRRLEELPRGGQIPVELVLVAQRPR